MESAARDRMSAYLTSGLGQVEGWFSPYAAEVIAELTAHQISTGVAGNLAEIGIHHGKLFLLLANGAVSGEIGVALDVFENQEKNVDRSGLGDRQQFEKNLARWAPGAEVKIVQASSLEVTPASAPSTFGSVRMFSIDGGHTSDITLHDLRLAESVLVDGGVAVVDDILNDHWLGVVSGVARYLLSEHSLVPFAVGSNKLLLTTSDEHAASYRRHLAVTKPELLGKRNVPFFDDTVDVYGKGSPRDKRDVSADAARTRKLERRIAELEASTSWRVTAPMRMVTGVFKRR